MCRAHIASHNQSIFSDIREQWIRWLPLTLIILYRPLFAYIVIVRSWAVLFEKQFGTRDAIPIYSGQSIRDLLKLFDSGIFSLSHVPDRKYARTVRRH